MAATLDPEVMLHQSPDLPWGGEFHGNAGYEDWARQMSEAFDQLEVKDRQLFAEGGTVVAVSRLVTHSLHLDRVLCEPASLPYGGEWRGRGGVERWMRMFKSTWSSLEVRDPEVFGDGDVTFSRSHVDATAGDEHGDQLGAPPAVHIRTRQHLGTETVPLGHGR